MSQITFKQSGTTRMTTIKQYDHLNRLTQIQSSAGGSPVASFNYSYNNVNQREKNTLADGSYWIYSYDTLGQVTGGNKYFADGTAVPGQQFGYGFDDIGNRKQTSAGGNGATRIANYTVNSLNQITQRDYPGTNDVIGVALATNAVTVNGQTAWHKGEYFWSTVKSNNTAAAQWEGIRVAGGSFTNYGSMYVPQTPEHLCYDADGNLTNDGHWAYTWDAENRLIQMTVNINVGPQYQLQFGYDAKSRRIQKLVATNDGSTYVGQYTNNFLYDGWNVIAILNPQSSILQSFVWGTDLSGSMWGAGGVCGLLEMSYSGTNCFPAFDGNGNLAEIVNAADANNLASYEYGPFGETTRMTGPTAKSNPFRFSTKYQDEETSMLYFGFRYYNASTGVWPARDPLAEKGGRNLYAFVKNDPIDKYDLLGLLSAQYNGYNSGYLQHRSFMNFIAKCPKCSRLKLSSVSINKQEIGDAVKNDIQQAITHDLSIIQELTETGNPDYDPTINGYEAEIKDFQKAIDDINANPNHISGLKEALNKNCDGNDITLHIYMNTRFAAQGPITLTPTYVRDEKDIYIKTTKVDYECEPCN